MTNTRPVPPPTDPAAQAASAQGSAPCRLVGGLREQRRFVECFNCGSSAKHDHHVVPRAYGGTKTVPLCERCHSLVHGRNMVGTSRMTKAALAHKSERGERVGQIPFGFALDADGVHLVPEADEQAVIATVRDLRAAGLSLRAIAARLNADAAPCRGSRWHLTTVARIVRCLRNGEAVRSAGGATWCGRRPEKSLSDGPTTSPAVRAAGAGRTSRSGVAVPRCDLRRPREWSRRVP